MPRKLSDLSVTIQEGDVFALISPEQLMALVERRGYSYSEYQGYLPEHGLIGYMVDLPKPVGLLTGVVSEQTLAPVHNDFSDYRRRVREFVHEIAEAEGRGPLAILLELLGVEDTTPELPDTSAPQVSE